MFRDRSNWHRWFAWYPVRLLPYQAQLTVDPIRRWVWLQVVERIWFDEVPLYRSFNRGWVYQRKGWST